MQRAGDGDDGMHSRRRRLLQQEAHADDATHAVSSCQFSVVECQQPPTHFEVSRARGLTRRSCSALIILLPSYPTYYYWGMSS